MRFLLSLALPLALASTHCGGVVSSDATPSIPSETAETVQPWTESASCAAVTQSCVGAEAVVVRGHATLKGLDGARVEFAIRHASKEGSVFVDAHEVALGRTWVREGSFETCVCVPQGANMYPQIAAVVYQPGSKGTASADVARATFSQRYATLGEEDVSYALEAIPSDLQKEAAVAATIERTASVRVRNLVVGYGVNVLGGLVANERPIAAQVTNGQPEDGGFSVRWTMPGKAWPSERFAFFVDQNGNGRCDDGDKGAITPFAQTMDAPSTWLEGASLSVVCDALRAGSPRE